MSTTTEAQAKEPKGALYQSLARNNKEILKDRAETISEDLETTFSRNAQDLSKKLKRLNRDRNNMYDFSPTNTQSLMLGKEVQADDILIKDMKLSIEIRQIEIELEIAINRYEYLFGVKPTL